MYSIRTPRFFFVLTADAFEEPLVSFNRKDGWTTALWPVDGTGEPREQRH